MQALKLLVIVMGVLIIAGVAVIVITVMNRSGHGAAGFGSAALTLPKGCHLIGMVNAGDRLALRLGDSPDCQLVLFVDPQSGQQTGSLAVQSQP